MKTQATVAAADLKQFEFEAGEVYLFHPTDPACPAESSLWGIVSGHTKAGIYLESSSNAELQDFVLYGLLSCDYRYCRLATRSELHDYVYALALCERRRNR